MLKAAALLISALSTLALAAAVPAARPDQPATRMIPSLRTDFDNLVATERAFAALGERKGIKESFLAYIADDGVLFRPGPVNGKEWLTGRPNPQVVLSWAPAYAEIARSADLGWTTGPWDLTAEGSPQEHGQFATAWKRQADGGWKFVVDLGISTPRPPPRGEPKLSPELAEVEPQSVAKADPAAARAALLDAERGLAQAITARGTADAYLASVASDVHLLRDGRLPFVGKGTVRAALIDDPGGLTFEPAGADVSAAGDLGYVYGTARRRSPEEAGVFFRVWKRIPGGAWQITLDAVKLKAVARKPG
jgi:ketosteroid isomerase-like protein